MQESRRLIDEAIVDEPVKNTFRLAWEFIILNRQFTFTAMSLLLLLNILSAFLGMLAMAISGIFSMAIQIYVSKLIYGAENIDDFLKKSKISKVEMAVGNNISSATGAYFGGLTLMLGVLFLLLIWAQSMGFPLEKFETLQGDNLFLALKQLVEMIALPLLLILLGMIYINPLVQSRIVMAKDFKGGYMAVFSTFSLSLWRKSFQNGYPQYILLLMSLIFMAALVLGIFITMPFINLLASFIFIVVMYGYMVLISIASMISKRMIES